MLDGMEPVDSVDRRRPPGPRTGRDEGDQDSPGQKRDSPSKSGYVAALALLSPENTPRMLAYEVSVPDHGVLASSAPPKHEQRVMPAVRDHTTDQLGPGGDEYIPRVYDEAGEKKVTATGHLQDNREYKMRTFCVSNRGDKLFMLATECARVLGYRDSYLLFNKNRSLYKIIANQDAKDDLIHQEILPYSYRSRQISIVTAKSMFRQFGSRLIVNGQRVRDDYWEDKARKQGFTEKDRAGDRRTGVAKAAYTLAADTSVAASHFTRNDGDNAFSNSLPHRGDLREAGFTDSTGHRELSFESLHYTHLEYDSDANRLDHGFGLPGSTYPSIQIYQQSKLDPSQGALSRQSLGDTERSGQYQTAAQASLNGSQQWPMAPHVMQHITYQPPQRNLSTPSTWDSSQPASADVPLSTDKLLSRFGGSWPTPHTVLQGLTHGELSYRDLFVEQRKPSFLHANRLHKLPVSTTILGRETTPPFAQDDLSLKDHTSGQEGSQSRIPTASTTTLETANMLETPASELDKSSKHLKAQEPLPSLSPSSSILQDSGPCELDDETEYSTDEVGDSLCGADTPNIEPVARRLDLLSPSLSGMQRLLVDRIMIDFWNNFGESLKLNVTANEDPEQNNTAENDAANEGSRAPSTVRSGREVTVLSDNLLSSGKGKGKRKINDDDDDGVGDDRGRDSKRPSIFSSPPILPEDRTKFACPYRKQYPRKYRSSNRQWRSCALTPLENVARVKAHLYRHHMIYPCQRCKQIFKGQEEVGHHLQEAKSCELRDIELGDGITCEIVQQLRSRKKTYRGETEEEKWRKIYSLLFPETSILSPYFEQPSDSTELEEYEEYCRRELPRVVRATVEEIVNRETQPIEDRLINQLENIVRIAHEQVLANYRSSQSSNTASLGEMAAFIPQVTHSRSYSWINTPLDSLITLNPLDQQYEYNLISQLVDDVAPPPSEPGLRQAPRSEANSPTGRTSQQAVREPAFQDDAAAPEISLPDETIINAIQPAEVNANQVAFPNDDRDWDRVSRPEDSQDSKMTNSNDFGWDDLELRT